MPDHKFQSQYADVNDIRLHFISVRQGNLIMFVHGFPEFWAEWENQLVEFGNDHQAVALDMRGYNLSSKPEDVEKIKSILNLSHEMLTVKVPTLVIWGEQDRALLTGNRDGLEEYVEDLTVKRLPEGSHWVSHEQPERVNALIRDFI